MKQVIAFDVSMGRSYMVVYSALRGCELEEKVMLFIRQFENTLSTYDMTARQLTAKEYRDVLHHLVNFSNH